MGPAPVQRRHNGVVASTPLAESKAGSDVLKAYVATCQQRRVAPRWPRLSTFKGIRLSGGSSREAQAGREGVG